MGLIESSYNELSYKFQVWNLYLLKYKGTLKGIYYYLSFVEEIIKNSVIPYFIGYNKIYS